MSGVDTETVASPCTGVCTLDDDDVCIGCFRTMSEICTWGTADNTARREILERAVARERQQQSA